MLGDFGVGIVDGRLDGARQLLLARALDRPVRRHDVRLVISTGDNVYLGHEDTAGTGNEDDDWYSSFYQPYRYVLDRVPFFPTVGNHDAGDTESSDDRDQLADNLFHDHRFRPEVETGSASLDPGLFYRFQVGADLEFICIDTSIASDLDVEHYFDDPSTATGSRTCSAAGARWRIPFSHHPPFCAGPEHPNTAGMVERLVPLFEQRRLAARAQRPRAQLPARRRRRHPLLRQRRGRQAADRAAARTSRPPVRAPGPRRATSCS